MAVELHPDAFVPVTVYVVVAVGLICTVLPVWLFGIQLYVDAPALVSVTFEPLQAEAAEVLAVTEGDARTPIATVAVFTQPFASVPVTVYVVADDGVTVTLLPERFPGIHE